MIRGRSLADALSVTQFSSKRAARFIDKVLKSAQANAQDQGETSLGGLVVKTARADEGPTRRKFRCRARGMASPIRSRTSHIVITLADSGQAEG
jgi:large subunit ribosomal protein L22